jgi:NADP-dependent 3-hydroxy acid dehydrogenase YdfG
MLLNNAGVNHPNLILDLSDGDIDSMFDTNVKAHFYTIQAFLPHMLARGSGHIVCTASALSYVGASLMSASERAPAWLSADACRSRLLRLEACAARAHGGAALRARQEVSIDEVELAAS